MADSVKWIKMTTDLFNNRKIKQIRKMPEGDAIIGVWLQILCLAGDINNGGLVYFSQDIPYTYEMLATEFERPNNIIRLALQTFEAFRMIYLTDDVICVSNWEKYQSNEKLEEIREKNRLRQQRYRENQRELLSNVTVALPVTHSSISISSSNSLISNKEKERIIPYQEIVDLYNNICSSMPNVKKLTDKRKNKIKARYSELEDLSVFEQAFLKADQSSFLKGSRGWTASFDWLMENDTNIVKVLEGHYDDKSTNPFKQKLEGEYEQARNDLLNGDNQNSLPRILPPVE